MVDYRQQLGGQRVQVHLVAEPAAERGDRAGGVIAAAVEAAVDQGLDAAAGWLEHCRYRQGRGRHDQAGVAAQQLPKPQHDRGVGASQQDREQQVGERAADDAVQVVEAIAQVNVLIDGLSPTPGAHRYRAAYPSATPKQLRETALSDWLYRMPALHLAEAADLGVEPEYGSTSRAGDSGRVALLTASTRCSCAAPLTLMVR